MLLVRAPIVLGTPLAVAVAAAAAATAACGGSHASRPDRTVRTPTAHVLRTTCAQSWWPTSTTFENRAWRKDSVNAGPVTFLNAKLLARAPVQPNTSVKIRTLVQPRTPVTLTIDRDSQARAGFVPLSNGGAAGLEAAKPVARLDGCPGVPPAEQAVKGISDVGYPVSVAVARPTCVAIDVTPAGGSTQRIVLAIGVHACSVR
jgi:hypothetical protein